MAKYVLNNSDEDLDFALIGISCAEEQYSVAATIESALTISLQLSDYVSLALKDNKVFNFSLYTCVDEDLSLEYCFIPNLSNFDPPNINQTSGDLFSDIQVEERVRLIKELPKTDYFLLLKGEETTTYQFRIFDKLRLCPEFLQVTLIEPKDLPSKRNLIF